MVMKATVRPRRDEKRKILSAVGTQRGRRTMMRQEMTMIRT